MRFFSNYIILVAIIFVVSSCQIGNKPEIPSYLLSKEIPDWNEIYPLLIINAQKWDPDAGLRLAVLDISPENHPERRVVSAFFEAPNKGLEYLHVQYLDDENIQAEIVTHHTSLANFDPIGSNAQILNSTEAWDLFLQNPDVISFEPTSFDCAKLILINKQLEYEGERKVIWQLALDDCTEEGLVMFLIDATTGKFLGKETY